MRFQAALLATAVLAPSAAAAAAPRPGLPPVVYAKTTADFDVRVRIAPELARYGPAYARLRGQALINAAEFQKSAVEEKASEPKPPPTPAFAEPLVERIEIDAVVETPHLAGFVRRFYQDMHGAHPSSSIQAILIDRRSGQVIGATDLLRPDAPMAALNTALVQRVAAAKRARDRSEGMAPDGDVFANFDRPSWSAASHIEVKPPRSAVGSATLVRSGKAYRDGERAAGLQFDYGPYDIGPYADGAYGVFLPSRVFAAALKPEYRGDFDDGPAVEANGAPFPASGDPLNDFPVDVPRAER